MLVEIAAGSLKCYLNPLNLNVKWGAKYYRDEEADSLEGGGTTSILFLAKKSTA
jgi:hypothetical protein